MANWYHCSIKPISRSAGRSVVAAAAYRIGDRLHDDRTQTTHDYRRRSGVETHFMTAPAAAPDWATDPEKLWNAAEASERKINSRTAREIELALPAQVGKADREQIARDLAEHLSERYSVAVMTALHEPSNHGDDRNYHAHILMTTRRIDADGFTEKTRELDDLRSGKEEIKHIREYAADLINQALEKTGSDDRIDHRSFKDRGIEQIPTEHLSLAALAMEKRGEPSDMGNRNRDIAQRNAELKALAEQRAQIDAIITEREAEELPSKSSFLEQQKIAQRAINSGNVIAFNEDIKNTGEISQTGFKNLVNYVNDWVIVIGEELHKSMDTAYNAWLHLMDRDRPDSDPERER